MVGASYLFQNFLTDVQSTEVFTAPMCSYDTIITFSQRTPKLATASSLDTQPNHWDHRAYNSVIISYLRSIHESRHGGATYM